MGYIGRGPVKSGAFRIIDDFASSFNGSTTAFTLQSSSSNITPGTEQNLLIAVDGVVQEPQSAFTISGSTITFTSAPASGASFWGVELGDVGGVAQTIANDTVDGTKIADNAIDSEDYVDGSIDLAHMSSESVDEDNLHISNAGNNGEFLSKQSGNAGGLTWAAAGGPDQAVQSDIEAETNQDTYVPPDLIKHSPGVAKAWCRITDAGVLESPDYNVASITDTGTGNRTIVWDVDFSGTVYVITSSNNLSHSGANIIINDTFAAGSVRHRIYIASALIDASTGVAAFGDQ